MKKLFYFSTRPSTFLVEVPPALLLVPTIIYNSSVNTPMRLYPLIFALSALIIFFAIYFFRAVSISYEEIKCIGNFSSKEKAVIKEERALLITLLKRNRIRIELFGKNDDGDMTYAWLKNDTPAEINLFRAKINGGMKRAGKILRYFDADIENSAMCCEDSGLIFDSDKISVFAEKIGGFQTFKILFKQTI